MPFVAGNDIDANCPQCLRDQNHTVIEVHGGIVQQVRCSACKSIHPYKRPQAQSARPTKASSGPAKRRTTKPKRARAASGPPQEWQDRVLTADEAEAKPYSTKETFAADDLISHSKFGIGVVVATLDDGKLDVAFREGVKRLVHSRK